MRILVADDDSGMQHLWTDMLTALGHEPVVTKDGEEALLAYRTADEGHFDFVLTDYQMPKKNGVVLLMEIRARRPSQKMALASAGPPTPGPSSGSGAWRESPSGAPRRSSWASGSRSGRSRNAPRRPCGRRAGPPRRPSSPRARGRGP